MSIVKLEDFLYRELELLEKQLSELLYEYGDCYVDKLYEAVFDEIEKRNKE